MAKATLVLDNASHAVAGLSLLTNCTLCTNNLALAVSSYRVSSSVAVDSFRLFVEAIESKEIQITKRNVADPHSYAPGLVLRVCQERFRHFWTRQIVQVQMLKREPESRVWKNEFCNKIFKLRVSRRSWGASPPSPRLFRRCGRTLPVSPGKPRQRWRSCVGLPLPCQLRPQPLLRFPLSLTPPRRLEQRFRRSKRFRKRRPLLPNRTRCSSRPFCRSSTSSAGSGLCFCGEEAAKVSAFETFTGDATDTRTHRSDCAQCHWSRSSFPSI
jgi:hypothetical protein